MTATARNPYSDFAEAEYCKLRYEAFIEELHIPNSDKKPEHADENWDPFAGMARTPAATLMGKQDQIEVVITFKYLGDVKAAKLIRCPEDDQTQVVDALNAEGRAGAKVWDELARFAKALHELTGEWFAVYYELLPEF